jgi:uncharacterized repeat protein (TIGR01451 family)
LLGLRGWGAAQGSGDGSPYPPSNSGSSARPIIASGQPVANTSHQAVVQFADPAVAPTAGAGPISMQPTLDQTVPPVPHPPSVKPVVPIPDDGLWSQRKLRKLPPPTQTLGTPTPPPEITIPAAPDTEPFVVRPEPPPRSPVQQVSHPPPTPPTERVQPSARTQSMRTIANTNPTPVAERSESPAGVPILTGAQTAILSLEVVGPAGSNRGKPFAYEIVLRNNGSTPAFQVQVEETLQTGVRCLAVVPQPDIRGGKLTWNLGTLAAGAEQRFRIEVQPPTDGEVVSSAQATFTTSSSLRTLITQPQLSLKQLVPETAQVGEEVVLQLQVANSGTGTATHVLVRDQLPPGLRHPGGAHVEADVGTLAAGETKTLTLRAQVVQMGRQVNEAVASGDDCASVTSQSAISITQAAIALRETSPRQGVVNQEMEYRLDVASTGSAPATNVRLTDVLPQGMEFVSASDAAQYDTESRTLSWSLGTLASGQIRGVTFRVQTRLGGDYMHQATATADHGLEAKAAGSVRTEGVAALTVSVVDLENLVEVNAATTYEIRVVNQGSGTCSNVRIAAIVPDGLVPMTADGPSVNRVQGQQVVFEPVPQLAAQGELVYRVKVKGRTPGDWRFKVQLTSDQLPHSVTRETSTRVVGE